MPPAAQTKSKKSVWMAVGVVAAAALWMVSGVDWGAGAPVGGPAPDPAENLMRVRVQDSYARRITREIVVSGRSEPNRTVEVRAETDGRVVALGAARGAAVAAGERLVLLDRRDRDARLAEARATLAQAELQLEAARRLRSQQFAAEVQIAEALARVESARARLAEIELEIANTDVVAPFDAVIQERSVELGDYVSSGDVIAELVDVDPLIIAGAVNEREIRRIGIGARGQARLVGGEPLEGTIRYISPVADEATRTFRVELAVPNPERTARAGVTAELRLAGEEIEAHQLSPALLTLDDSGRIGVKAVNRFDEVEFWPVEIASSTAAGIAVTGLPQQIRLITVGQGFVQPGQRVVPVPEAVASVSDAAQLPAELR